MDPQTYAENYAKTFSRVIDDPSGYDDRQKECPPVQHLTTKESVSE